LTILDEEFTRRKYSYREFPISKSQNNTPIHLKLKFSPAVRANAEEYFNPENITCLDDGCLIVEVDWPEDEWVYGHILSYGGQVEVLEPEEVREKIRKRAAKLYEVYCL
jgi:predicted DNA-binding transcriptional regulator YafY